MMGSAKEIADMIDQLQVTYAAASTTLILLNDDDVLRLLETKGFDRGSTIRLGRRDDTYYEGIKFWDSIYAVRGNAAFNLNFFSTQFMMMLSWVGDQLSRNDYFDKTPELEFFRHLRNSISHGNVFHFKKGEPRRPARFKDFHITSSLHGKSVLFEFINTGDLFDLFDHVKAHLRAIHGRSNSV